MPTNWIWRQCIRFIHTCNGTRSYYHAFHLNHLARSSQNILAILNPHDFSFVGKQVSSIPSPKFPPSTIFMYPLMWSLGLRWRNRLGYFVDHIVGRVHNDLYFRWFLAQCLAWTQLLSLARQFANLQLSREWSYLLLSLPTFLICK